MGKLNENMRRQAGVQGEEMGRRRSWESAQKKARREGGEGRMLGLGLKSLDRLTRADGPQAVHGLEASRCS